MREIRGGAMVVITDRGIPVAQLGPVSSSKGIPAGAVELAQQGRLILPAKAPVRNWRSLPFPKAAPGTSTVAALLAERAESP